MKFALALLVALVASASARIEVYAPNGALDKEIQDFLKLIPVDKIVEITMRYMSEDEEFQKVIEFLQGEEFKKLVDEVEKMKDVINLMNYIYNAGFDIYKWVNQINDLLGLPHLTPPDSFVKPLRNYAGKGIRGYLDEIEALLPVDKLRALFDDKMKNAPVWRDFINQLKSPTFQDIVNKVYVNPTVQKMVKRAGEMGVDLKRIKDLLLEILGIKIPDVPPKY